MLVALAAAAYALDAPRHAGISAGLGASWILGGNAAGFTPGAAERLALDVPTGDLVSFTLELDHARHGMADAGAWFPGDEVPADSIAGFRDYLCLDAGFRLGIDAGSPAEPGRLRGVPFVRLGVAGVYTSAVLSVPGLAGATVLRSATLWPAPSLATGAELRVRRWLTVVPQLKAQLEVVEDTPESSDDTGRAAFEVRLQPAVDAVVHF